MRIAVFRALFLGDLLLAVPALRALRAGFPQAEITMIGLPWSERFWARYPHYIDRFLAFPGYPGINEVPVVPERTAHFLRQQQAYSYDLALQLHGSGQTSNPFVRALGAHLTAGCSTGPTSELDLAVPYPEHQSEIERTLAPILALGCPHRGTDLEFPLLPADIEAATRLLAPLAGRPLIGIHPGASTSARRWPAKRFARLADELARRYDAGIVLTGSGGELETTLAVERAMETEALSLAGQTDLGTLGAVIVRCDLFLSNDTGPAHLAVAMDTPSVTLFGPAELQRWAHLQPALHPVLHHPVACSPCSFTTCPIDHRCLRGIGVQRVLAAAEQLLGEGVTACTA